MLEIGKIEYCQKKYGMALTTFEEVVSIYNNIKLYKPQIRERLMEALIRKSQVQFTLNDLEGGKNSLRESKIICDDLMKTESTNAEIIKKYTCLPDMLKSLIESPNPDINPSRTLKAQAKETKSAYPQ